MTLPAVAVAGSDRLDSRLNRAETKGPSRLPVLDS